MTPAQPQRPRLFDLLAFFVSLCVWMLCLPLLLRVNTPTFLLTCLPVAYRPGDEQERALVPLLQEKQRLRELLVAEANITNQRYNEAAASTKAKQVNN